MSKVKGGRWIQDSVTGKLIPRDQFVRKQVNAPAVHGDIVDFVSPITRELITDRGQLRRHNKEHGVTNSADYSPEFMAKRSKARDDEMTGNTREARAERRELINQSMRRYGA